MAPKLVATAARYKSCAAGWQLGPRLAVALALVVLDRNLDLLGLVGQIVGILQCRVVGLGVVGYHVVDVLRLLGLGEELGLGQSRRCRCRRRGCRRRRGAPAPDFDEVLAIVLPASLGAFDRALVQVVEARCTVLAGALGTPGRLDHAGSPEFSL